MRALNAVRRILLLLLLIPVVAIALNALLQAFGAQAENPIVKTVRQVARYFILDPFRTVFPDQGYVQTALVSLAAYGILALLIVFLFRGLRSMVSAKPPRVRSEPAKKDTPAPPAEKPVVSPKPPAETTTVKSEAGSSSDPTDAKATSGAETDGQSTSG